VLAVDGTAEVQAQNATTWEQLRFRDDIMVNDTVRTGANGKVKILLRDDSIMTLGERSEMQFTEFLLTQEQRRTVVSLLIGTVRVVTTRLFGPGSVTEVRTPNTVAGVRGTTFLVRFIPPDTTEIISLDGVVTARNLDPAIPQIEPVPQNFRTRIVGATPPTRAAAVPPSELQAIEQELRMTEQVPTEVLPTGERQALGLPLPTLTELPGLANVITPTAELPQASVGAGLQDRVSLLSQVLSPDTSPQGLITPDTSPAAQGAIQGSQPLRLIITFPRRQ
jgi:hypothetical protein